MLSLKFCEYPLQLSFKLNIFGIDTLFDSPNTSVLRLLERGAAGAGSGHHGGARPGHRAGAAAGGGGHQLGGDGAGELGLVDSWALSSDDEHMV